MKNHAFIHDVPRFSPQNMQWHSIYQSVLTLWGQWWLSIAGHHWPSPRFGPHRALMGRGTFCLQRALADLVGEHIMWVGRFFLAPWRNDIPEVNQTWDVGMCDPFLMVTRWWHGRKWVKWYNDVGMFSAVHVAHEFLISLSSKLFVLLAFESPSTDYQWLTIINKSFGA